MESVRDTEAAALRTMTPPAVSRPRLSGVTSSSSRSCTFSLPSPLRMAACAPQAIDFQLLNDATAQEYNNKMNSRPAATPIFSKSIACARHGAQYSACGCAQPRPTLRWWDAKAPRACTAAPYATASSGLMLLFSSLPLKKSCSICCTFGMRVLPPTSTISCTCRASFP